MCSALIAATLAVFAAADLRIEWLKQNAAAVRSIDIADADFEDLEPLKQRIGDARLVLLGEQSHGDGATFQAKARLIRFLHERMGFDVLAWESGLFDCEQMETALASEMPLSDAVARGVFAIWGRSAQVIPLFEYVRASHRTARPLIMAGFDSQFSSGYGVGTYARWLFEFLDRAYPGAVPAADRALIEASVPPLGGGYAPTPAEHEARQAAIARALAIFDRPPRDKRFQMLAAFFRQTLRGLASNEELRSRPREEILSSPQLANTRDKMMAENLIWLAKERYAGKRIAVWAASAHILRGAVGANYEKFVPMGERIFEAFGNQAYSIAFTAYRGTVGDVLRGRANQWRLPVPAVESLEALLHAAGNPYAFLDLRSLPADHWLRRPISARPLGYSAKVSDWPSNFDAFFYTDVMIPSTPATIR